MLELFFSFIGLSWLILMYALAYWTFEDDGDDEDEENEEDN